MKHSFTFKKSVITATEYYSSSDNTACVIFFGSDELGQHLAGVAKRCGLKIVLIGIDGEDWNRDLSPWCAPKVFRSEDDFTGGADEYLDFLCATLIPQVEYNFPAVKQRTLMGYSLAGLFAVYSLYRTNMFNSAASVSGSLWYDGFIEFAGRNTPMVKPHAVYLSLGDKERNTRNPRMAAVEQCTQEMGRIMTENGIKTIFELNPGNHFADVERRMEKALLWLETGNQAFTGITE